VLASVHPEMAFLSDLCVTAKMENAHVFQYAALFRFHRSLISNKKSHFWINTDKMKGGEPAGLAECFLLQ